VLKELMLVLKEWLIPEGLLASPTQDCDISAVCFGVWKVVDSKQVQVIGEMGS